MFAIHTLTITLPIPCTDYSSSLSASIKKSLLEVVEGKTLPIGFILCVTEILSVKSEEINSEAIATFSIVYKALVLKVVEGTCFDTTILEINKMGLFSSVGPLSIFISNYQLKSGQNFEKESQIRLRVIGSKVEGGKIYTVGTLKDEVLGLI